MKIGRSVSNIFFKILIAVFFTAGLYSESSKNSAEIILAVDYYFSLIKNIGEKDKKESLLKILDDKIALKFIDDNELKKLINDLMLNNISPLFYLRKISGANINKFIELQNNKKLELNEFKIITDVVTDENIIDNKLFSYSFIKAELTISEVEYDGSTNVVKKNQYKKICEIDIIEDNVNKEAKNGKYKIFGFIL